MYDQELKRKWDNAVVLANTEQKAEARGQARGEEIGKTRGKQESRIEIGRALKNEGITKSVIVKSTGLSADAILAILNLHCCKSPGIHNLDSRALFVLM